MTLRDGIQLKVGDLVKNKFRKGTEGHPIGIVTKTPAAAKPAMPADDGNLWTSVYWLRGEWVGTEVPLPTYHIEVINNESR